MTESDGAPPRLGPAQPSSAERPIVARTLTPRADAWTRAVLGPPSGTRSGIPPTPGARRAHDETLEDLRRVIRRIESRHAPRPAAEPIERLIGGEIVDTGAGALLVVRREYPLSHRHGCVSLEDAFTVPPERLRIIGGHGEEGTEPGRLLFVDTETTGLAGGTGTYAFLIGVGAVEGDRFVVTQYFMRDLDEEPALLAALGPRLDSATGIVTFNGAGFDLPLLETRFILARRRWPLIAHVDLLRPARRVWLGHLPDCRLSTVERQALGLERQDDVPGAMIPALYFEFLRTRHARPLARVFAHNRDDVLSLVALLGWFSTALACEGGGLAPLELAGLGRLVEPLDVDRGLAYYRAALDGGLEGPAALATSLRLAAWEKRRERWHEACALWEVASRQPMFDPRPWEELAKYHEHQRHDFSRARDLVSSAIDLARAAAVGERVLDEFTHRLARLERRLAAGIGRLATAAASGAGNCRAERKPEAVLPAPIDVLDGPLPDRLEPQTRVDAVGGAEPHV